MENQSSTKWSRFSIAILSELVIATFICIFRSLFFEPFFLLNENQLLYLFSSMAQIIGGVFGLTLTAYVFFVDKFKESARNDDTFYDATSSLLSRYFHILILIAVSCGATVFMCIAGIIALHNWTKVYPFIIDESVFLFLIGITTILVFGTMLLDPNKLDKEITKMKKQAEQHYQTAESAESGDFRLFLKTYNQLEQLIISFAKEFVSEQKAYYPNYKPQIIQSLNVLNNGQIINGALLDEMHGLRMYRNGLVHGTDLNVSQEACTRILEIHRVLSDSFGILRNSKKGSEEWVSAIKKIYGLTNYQ